MGAPPNGSPSRTLFASLIVKGMFDSWNFDHKAFCNEMTIVSLLKSLEFNWKRILKIQQC